MTIEEMREKKVAAEKAMTEILRKFESETGTVISETWIIYGICSNKPEEVGKRKIGFSVVIRL
jgi:hypothetical protein